MKALGIGTSLIVLVAASALLDQETGVAIWLELRESLAVSTARVMALEQGNETLRREIEMLEDEPTGLDRAIREELDLVLPGESIVYFTDAATTPQSRRLHSRTRSPEQEEAASARAEAATAANDSAVNAATDAIGNEWLGTR